MFTLFVPGQNTDIVLESIYAILRSNRLLSLATLQPAGTPYSNTAFYAFSERMSLIIFSEPRKQHSTDLLANPAFSATVFDSHQMTSPLSGLQILGSGRLVSGREVQEAHAIYGATYKWLLESAPEYTDVESKFESRFWELSIEKLRVYDEVRFGAETIVDVEVRRTN